MATKVPDIEKLGATNYATWSQDMLAWLGTQQLKRLVLGKQKAPSPADPNNITDAEQAAIEAWEDMLEVDLHSIGKYVSCSCLVPFLDMMLIIYMATLILSLSLFSFRTLSCYDIYGYPC